MKEEQFFMDKDSKDGIMLVTRKCGLNVKIKVFMIRSADLWNNF